MLQETGSPGVAARKEETAEGRGICEVQEVPCKEEKVRMEECFAESGFRKKQNYIIQALCQKPMATDKEISDLEAVLKRLDALYDQLRRIGTNVNQITVRMHADKIVPEMREIKGITTELRKEVDEQWRSIKSQMQKLQATQR